MSNETRVVPVELLDRIRKTCMFAMFDTDYHKLSAILSPPAAPVTTQEPVDESAEFEKWRKEQIASLMRMGYPDAARAFRDLGSVQWAGWQARAALERKTC